MICVFLEKNLESPAMKKFLLLSLSCAAFAFEPEFPEVIDFRHFPSFEKVLVEKDKHSWEWALANSAFEVGYTTFQDSPEIGTVLTLLKNDYHLDAAVETGSSLSSTAHYFSVNHAIDSIEALQQILPSLKEKRLLFYLNRIQVLSQIEVIHKTHQGNAIFVIDGVGSDPIKDALSQYTLHHLISRQSSSMLVAIPRKWEKELYWKAGTVDILSGFSIYDFPIQLKNVADAGYQIQMRYQYPYGDRNSAYDPDLKKIIVFGWTLDPKVLAGLPREKLLFFNMEPQPFAPEYYDHFPKVYTCCDDLVDGVKFFKLHYPYLMPMHTDLPPFEEKKFCVMVSGSDNEYPERKNELYSERMKMVEFFETKPAGELDVYGRYWVKRHYRDFRGAIPGDHSGIEKILTLKKYRFSICFENTKDLDGYITEKIFACFAAGCVPVYWGPGNIETYIPKDCFIDYRDFKDREELYQVLKTMPKATYEQYLESIRTFLSSERAQVFSPAFFEKTIYEAISQ
jgi:hypothetical protein